MALTILDPILGPLLKLGDFWAMFIITFGLSLIITLVYKYVTDQEMMKRLKAEIKQLQQQSKEHRKDTNKMMALQKQMMDKNMVLMKHSMKPTLFTFIPLLLIMGWLQGHVAFAPIHPGDEFAVTVVTDKTFHEAVHLLDTPGITLLTEANQTAQDGAAVFRMKGTEGLYTLQFTAPGASFNTDVRISAGRAFGQQLKSIKQGAIKQVAVAYPKNILIDLGFWKVGWVGTYILLSLVFSLGLRKLLRVY